MELRLSVILRHHAPSLAARSSTIGLKPNYLVCKVEQ